MNIVFTCGGTGGHIYPAIAVARMFRERQPDCRILFIGAEDGMENKLVPREGFELQTVQISNYQRKLTPAAIWHNLVTVQRMSATFAKTKRILKDFRPDVIVGTGGYASFPALKMGAKLGIPTCVHESNAVPGLTTKLVARTASRIMVSFDASRQHYPDPEKVLLTGTPVREEFLYAKRQQARQALGLGDEPLIVSCWGGSSAGSSRPRSRGWPSPWAATRSVCRTRPLRWRAPRRRSSRGSRKPNRPSAAKRSTSSPPGSSGRSWRAFFPRPTRRTPGRTGSRWICSATPRSARSTVWSSAGRRSMSRPARGTCARCS